MMNSMDETVEFTDADVYGLIYVSHVTSNTVAQKTVLIQQKLLSNLNLARNSLTPIYFTVLKNIY